MLIYNTQTEGSVPEQIRSAAEDAGIPVVNVTETVAPGAKSFEAWQVDQLTALAKALGVSCLSRRTSPSAPALSLSDVSVVRGGALIWSEGTFDVPSGGIFAVIGSNGSGKTTLLQVVLGLIPPRPASPGLRQTAWRGHRRDRLRAAELRGRSGKRDPCLRRGAARIDRQPLGIRSRDRRQSDASRRSWKPSTRAEFAQRRLSQLSGGQRQRIAIAEALVVQAQAADPRRTADARSTSAISATSSALLARIRVELGVTILVVAHDLNPLLACSTARSTCWTDTPISTPWTRSSNEDLLSHLYGTSIQVVHTPQGELYMRSV